MKFKLKKISGDASFRQFYRLGVGRKKTIIVRSKKEKFRNLITYSIINRFLQKKGILTPISYQINKNFDRDTIRNINMRYAKDYNAWVDIYIILRCLNQLG